MLATRPAFSLCGSWRVRSGLPSPDDSNSVVNSVDTLGLLTALCTSRLKESSNSRVFTTRQAGACARDYEPTNSPAHKAMHTAKLLTNSTGGCTCDRDWQLQGGRAAMQLPSALKEHTEHLEGFPQEMTTAEPVPSSQGCTRVFKGR